jgi:hypothetical protein
MVTVATMVSSNILFGQNVQRIGTFKGSYLALHVRNIIILVITTYQGITYKMILNTPTMTRNIFSKINPPKKSQG